MKITITVSVRGDDFTTLTHDVVEDQEPIFLASDRPDRPIKVVRNAALRKTREALDKLIAKAAR